MAEIRKHNPDEGEGLGKLVREALGEQVRPIEPGTKPQPKSSPAEVASEDDQPSAATLPAWPGGDGITFQF